MRGNVTALSTTAKVRGYKSRGEIKFSRRTVVAEKLPKLARNELKQEKSRHIVAILLPIGLPAPISRETNDFN